MHLTLMHVYLHTHIHTYTQDLDNCVTVFVSDSENKEQLWQFLARHRAHYKTIEGKQNAHKNFTQECTAHQVFFL